MDYFSYQNGTLHAEAVAIDTLAQAVGTPFYCYSRATLARHVDVLREALSSLSPKICFAVKANSNVAVLAALRQAGAGADVVSMGEIRQALAAGIAPENMVFSGVGKTREEMAYALSQRIFQFNVESQPELVLLSDVALSMGLKAPVALRVNPDVDPKTHAKISTGQKESKFGIAMEEALPMFQLAASLPGIEVRGISVHIGSQLTSLTPFAEAYARVKSLYELLAAQGITIHTIDLGGGLGVPYQPSAEPPLPAAYGEMASKIFHGLPCQFIVEPGRLIAGNAGILVTRVLYVKQSRQRMFVIVDAAMNDLLRPSLYDAYHEIVPVRETSGALVPVDIVGPVCETGDTFAEQRTIALPAEGDLLAFRTAGAYGAVMASHYNSRLLSPEVLVDGERYAVVRGRGSYEALIARDTVPDWI